MLVAAGVVFGGAVLMLALAWLRRERPGLPLFGESERLNTGLVVAFGMGIPVLVLAALFVVANLIVIRGTEAPKASETTLTVGATGHQWWWEFRYPRSGAVTANEIHIPVGTEVNVVARSADVIHSFWVPELNRKVDMIPGRTNRIGLEAEETGTFRGQCAEFCGLQHANMAFDVVAEEPDDFRAWLRNMKSPARDPGGAVAIAGKAQFDEQGCADCHTIRGTDAGGTVGPDLTHLASRRTLAALTIPNRHGELNSWIADPQSIKPGAKMPGLQLTQRQLREIVAYLAGLR